MGVDGRIDTNQTMNWQRDVSSFLSSLTEFVNAFDVDKLTEEQKTKALKSLQKLVPPSAPATDGGVADTLRNVVAETKRLNNISFAGGCVVNNANGIGLFLEPNANESGGKPYGPILMPPLFLDPNPHTHSRPALSHGAITASSTSHSHDITHTHEASGSDSGHTHGLASHLHTLSAHVHSMMNHTHGYYKYGSGTDNATTSVPSVADTGVPSADTTGIPDPNLSASGTATVSVTVTQTDDDSGENEIGNFTISGPGDHAAADPGTGGTDIDIGLIAPA